MQPFPKFWPPLFCHFRPGRATLSYQVLITRFFSVMLYYHFAFAAISLAMLGLTRGAMEVFNNPERYAPERVGRIRAPCLLVRPVRRRRHDRLPLRPAGGARAFIASVLASTIAFVVPFTESGVCITLLLTRLPYSGGSSMPPTFPAPRSAASALFSSCC